MQAYLDRIDASTRASTRSSACATTTTCCARPTTRDAALGARREPRLDARHAAGDQGRCRDAGIRSTLGLAAAHGLRARARCADGRADEGGRLHRHRQDQHARVRPRLAHLQRGLRRHAQRLRPARTSAGGSSGGAAVALATRMLPVADGSDSMGSLRNPAAGTTCSASARARAACRAGRRRRLGRALGTEGPMARTVTRPRRCCSTCRPATTRACRCRSRRAPRRSPRRWTLATRAALRIGWLGDLDGHLAMEPGILELCARGAARARRLGCIVEPTRSASPRARLADAGSRGALVVGARIAPHLANPANRALIKPEALWEIDHGARLTGLRPSQASGRAHRCSTADARPLRALRRARAADRAGLAVPRRVALAAARSPAATMDTYHRWMEVVMFATFAGLPCISMPVGFERRRPADGRAADRPAARRPRRAAPRAPLRADHRPPGRRWRLTAASVRPPSKHGPRRASPRRRRQCR